MFCIHLLAYANQDHNQASCDFSSVPQANRVCAVDVANFGPCTIDNGFGYNMSSPCIFLKLNKVHIIVKMNSIRINKIFQFVTNKSPRSTTGYQSVMTIFTIYQRICQLISNITLAPYRENSVSKYGFRVPARTRLIWRQSDRLHFIRSADFPATSIRTQIKPVTWVRSLLCNFAGQCVSIWCFLDLMDLVVVENINIFL